MKLRLKKCEVMRPPKSNPNFIFTTMESEQTITSQESYFRIKRETSIQRFLFNQQSVAVKETDKMLEITR